MRKIKAHYDGKQIVLDEKVDLEPNTELFVILDESPNLGLASILGEPIDLGACDVTQEHNHYLYGTPKTNKGKEMSDNKKEKDPDHEALLRIQKFFNELSPEDQNVLRQLQQSGNAEISQQDKPRFMELFRQTVIREERNQNIGKINLKLFGRVQALFQKLKF